MIFRGHACIAVLYLLLLVQSGYRHRHPINGDWVPNSRQKIRQLHCTNHRLLIHIGVDTVELGGKFYTAHVKDGDVVKKGQTLITFDMDAIKAAGYDVTTPLIVTNTDDYEEVKMLAEGTVNNGSEVLEVK